MESSTFLCIFLFLLFFFSLSLSFFPLVSPSANLCANITESTE